MTAADFGLATTAGADEGRERRLRRLAALLSIVAIAEAAGLVTLGTRGDARFALSANLLTVGFFGTIVLYPVIGALIIQRRPSTRVAWLMVALGLGLGIGLLSAAYGALGQAPRQWPFALQALIVSQLFFVPSLGAAPTAILLLFPTDRLLGPAWRYVLAVSLVGLALFDVAAFLRPGEFDPVSLPGVRNPFSAPVALAPLVNAAGVAGGAMLVIGFVLATVSLVVRYRRAGAIEAAQIRWLAFVAVIAVPVIMASGVIPGAVGQLFSELGLVLLACMPIAIGIAITRYRLYDIDRLINRTIVYGSLTAILAGVFAAGTGVTQRIFLAVTGETSDAAIVAATLIVATLYTPLRKSIDTVVDRRFKYESRFGPYRDELEKTLSLVDAKGAAVRLAKEVSRETGSPDVAILGASGEPTAVVGQWPFPDATTIQIPGGRDPLMAIQLSQRSGQPAIDDRRRDDIAATAELAARAVRRPGVD